MTLATLHETDHNSNFQALLVREKEKPKLCVLCAKTQHLQGGAQIGNLRGFACKSQCPALESLGGEESRNHQACHKGSWCRGRELKQHQLFSILPAQGPRAEGCAVCPSSCCQGPKFPQLEHSGDSGPRLTGHPTLPHIWSASNLSALSYARGRAAGSSAEGEEERKTENFPSMLQTFLSGGGGGGGAPLSVEGERF